MGFKTIIKVKRSYIISAFNWGCGSDFVFWRGISIKWQKYLTADKDPSLHKTRCGYCGRFVKKEFWLIKGDPCVAVCNNCIKKIEVDWS